MRFLFIYLLLIQGALASLSPLATEQLVPLFENESFEVIKQTLIDHENSFRLKAKVTDSPPLRSGHPRYVIRDQKTSVVFIFIPGLYRIQTQFNHISKLIEPYGQNAIYLNLPGHGMDMYSARQVTFQDWIMAVERATKLAKKLGNKIVFVSQSTGGALSVLHTLKNQDDVAGLFLIEPAIKVQRHVSAFTCWTNLVIRSMNPIYKYANRDDKPEDLPYMSTKMGCEVDKIISRHLKKTSTERTRLAKEEDVFSAINVPTFILNNLSDKIVSPKHIARFSRQVSGPVHYVEIPKEGASYHGDADFMIKVIRENLSAFSDFMQTVTK